jgi:hypothetical protein
VSGVERRLVDRVGSYLRNPERTVGVTCEVCTTPIEAGTRCRRCREDHERFGGDLADLVVPVAYGGHNAQSRTLMYGYKTEVAAQPGDERRLLILLLLWVAVHLHRACLEQRAGTALDLWTTVPSTQGRSPHPLLEIARRAGLGPHELTSMPSSGQPADLRVTSAQRFSVSDGPLNGRHVLIVDDTWTTGGHAQSLALAARAAGAGRVAIVVLARWLTPDWPPTAAYLESHARRDFNPRICPVTGAGCP